MLLETASLVHCFASSSNRWPHRYTSDSIHSVFVNRFCAFQRCVCSQPELQKSANSLSGSPKRGLFTTMICSEVGWTGQNSQTDSQNSLCICGTDRALSVHSHSGCFSSVHRKRAPVFVGTSAFKFISARMSCDTTQNA